MAPLGRPCIWLFLFTWMTLVECSWVPGFDLAMSLSSPFDSWEVNGLRFDEVLQWFQEYICGNNCRETSTDARIGCSVCYCDEACFAFGDCCSSELLEKSNFTVPTPPACPPQPDGVDSYYMVTTCLPHLDLTEDGQKCRTSDLMTSGEPPVTDLQTQVTYLNKFCASCNNVTMYRMWSIVMDCTKGNPERAATASSAKELLRLLLKEKICDSHFQPPEGVTARACTPVSEPLISTCNVTGKWPVFDERVVRACAAYISPVLQFRNSFCYLCNSDIAWNMLSRKGGDGGIMKIPLIAVLNLQDDQPDSTVSPDADLTSLQRRRTSCAAASFLDPASGHCRPMTCSGGKMLKNGACVSVLSLSSFVGYHVTFYATLMTKQDDLQHIREHARKLTGYVISSLSNDFFMKSSSVSTTSIQCYNDEAVIELIGSMRVLAFDRHSPDRTESFLLTHFGSTLSRFSGSFGRASVRLSKRSTTDDPPLYARKQCQIDNLEHYEKSGHFSEQMPPDVVFESDNFVMKPLSPLLLCVHTDLKVDEFIYLHATNTLLIVATNATIAQPMFSLNRSLATVCVDEYLSGFNDTFTRGMNAGVPSKDNASFDLQTSFNISQSITAGIVSFSCTVISLTSITLTLAAYVFFKELRTISGVCNMCMFGVWFLAQAVFEFGVEQTKIAGLCVALGILAHYLWLSATFWMNACTLLLFSRLMFPLRARITLYSRAKVLGLSSVYALLSPALIVASAVTANFFLHGDLGYGGAICYIQRAATRRYGLALPIGCLVLMNVCLFLFAVIRLRRGSTVSSSAENKIGIFACTKLSVITGLSWLFMFLYEALPYQVVAYLAIVLFGLQGVVIFAVFAYKEYLARLHACLTKPN